MRTPNLYPTLQQVDARAKGQKISTCAKDTHTRKDAKSASSCAGARRELPCERVAKNANAEGTGCQSGTKLKKCALLFFVRLFFGVPRRCWPNLRVLAEWSGRTARRRKGGLSVGVWGFSAGQREMAAGKTLPAMQVEQKIPGSRVFFLRVWRAQRNFVRKSGKLKRP